MGAFIYCHGSQLGIICGVGEEGIMVLLHINNQFLHSHQSASKCLRDFPFLYSRKLIQGDMADGMRLGPSSASRRCWDGSRRL